MKDQLDLIIPQEDSIARAINPQNDTTENYQKANTPKVIDDIRDFMIYGPFLFENYCDILLTVKDRKFDLKWFKIDFIEKDRFRLTTSLITIIEPTIDDVLSYSEKYDIYYTLEPSQATKLFNEVHTEENQAMPVNSTLNLVDSQEKPEDKSITEEKGLKKSLRKLFKRKN